MKNKRNKSSVYRLLLNSYFNDDNPSSINDREFDDRGFDTNLLLSGNQVKNNWPRNFIVYVEGVKPVDYMLINGPLQIISDRVKEIIQLVDENICVEFLPVIMANWKTKDILDIKYWTINILEKLDILDWENTYWTTNEIPYDDPNALSKIIKPALKGDKVKNKHIFSILVNNKTNWHIFVSDVLKDQLEKKHATLGMEFTPIKVVSI